VLNLHSQTIPDVSHRLAAVLSCGHIAAIGRKGNRHDIIGVLDEMALGMRRGVINYTNASIEVCEGTVLQRRHVVLSTTASETVDPFQFGYNMWCVAGAPICLSPSFRRSYLTDPWLHSHELVSCTEISLSKLIKVVSAAKSAITLHLFDLGRDLSLLTLLPLSFDALTSLLSRIKSVLSEAFIIVFTFHFLVVIFHHLLLEVGTVVIIDVCVPDHDSLVVASSGDNERVVGRELDTSHVTTVPIVIVESSFLLNAGVLEELDLAEIVTCC